MNFRKAKHDLASEGTRLRVSCSLTNLTPAFCRAALDWTGEDARPHMVRGYFGCITMRM